ncbi:MAG: ACP S-malonyltransferase [Actinomycetota bacterium]
MRAGLFPGQGIPAGTVLDWLPEGDPLVTEAQMTLGYPLRRRVKITARRDGALLATELAQPAIFVASVRSWRETDAHFDFYAGHSLGEYSALVAAGALSFGDALEVVRARAEAMNRASKSTPGSMVAVLGMGIDEADAIARRAGVQVANDNAPDQVVLAGPEAALERAATLVSDAGARSVLLEVSGPFHTEGVATAADDLRRALASVDMREPKVPVLSNVTARPYGSADEIRDLLVTQLTHPVRWRESVEHLWSQGARDFVDFGPGKVVAGLAARVTRNLKRKEVPVGA